MPPPVPKQVYEAVCAEDNPLKVNVERKAWLILEGSAKGIKKIQVRLNNIKEKGWARAHYWLHCGIAN